MAWPLADLSCKRLISKIDKGTQNVSIDQVLGEVDYEITGLEGE